MQPAAINKFLIFKNTANHDDLEVLFNKKLIEMNDSKSSERARQIFKESLAFANSVQLFQLWNICKKNNIMPNFEKQELDIFSSCLNGYNLPEAHYFFSKISWAPSIKTACFFLEILLFKYNKNKENNSKIKQISNNIVTVIHEYHAFSNSKESNNIIKTQFTEQTYLKYQSNQEMEHLKKTIVNPIKNKKKQETIKRL